MKEFNEELQEELRIKKNKNKTPRKDQGPADVTPAPDASGNAPGGSIITPATTSGVGGHFPPESGLGLLQQLVNALQSINPAVQGQSQGQGRNRRDSIPYTHGFNTLTTFLQTLFIYL